MSNKEKTIKTIKFLGTKDLYPVCKFQLQVFLEELDCIAALNWVFLEELDCITAFNRMNFGKSITADDNEK
jgi:hypothetical protein